ncbi:MAG: hypothetical protein ACI8T1_004848 [Verrucomicrobiales bacterium]|jgi:hypothetical protein
MVEQVFDAQDDVIGQGVIVSLGWIVAEVFDEFPIVAVSVVEVDAFAVRMFVRDGALLKPCREKPFTNLLGIGNFPAKVLNAWVSGVGPIC